MSKTLVITRGEVGRYEDLFRQIGGVGRGETEDRDNYMKFKYAVGRNWKKLDSERGVVEKHVAGLMQPSPAYELFMQEREAIADKYAKRDENGNVIIHRAEDGSEKREFTPENQAAGEADLAVLKEKHAFAIAQYEAQEKEAEEYLKGELRIDLYAVPFAWVAEKIAGAWLDAIMVMVDNPPEI